MTRHGSASSLIRSIALRTTGPLTVWTARGMQTAMTSLSPCGQVPEPDRQTSPSASQQALPERRLDRNPISPISKSP